MTQMDIWLLLCMSFVFLALTEYAIILAIRFGQKKIVPKEKKEEHEVNMKHRCKVIDSWALKIFVGLDIFTVGTYFYCVHSYI